MSRADAQEYNVTASGKTTIGNGVFSSFQQGTPFSVTFEFNAATAVATDYAYPTGPTVGNYIDSLGSATFSAGTLVSTGTAPLIQIFSGTPNYGNGYVLEEYNTGSNYNFELMLLGTDPAIAPTTDLSSIHSVSVGDFNLPEPGSADFAVAAPGTDGDLYGTISSFDVETVSTPEPASAELGFLALMFFCGVLGLRHRNCRRL